MTDQLPEQPLVLVADPADEPAAGGDLGIPIVLGPAGATVPFGSTEPDGAGGTVEWICSDLQGWSDTPELAGEVTKLPDRHGAWISPALLEGRTLTLDGWIITASARQLQRALHRLYAAAPLRPVAVLAVAEDDEPKQLLGVRRSGSIKVEHIGDAVAHVQLGLVCGDPRRFSTRPDTGQTTIPLPIGGGLKLPKKFPFKFPERPRGGFLKVTNRGTVVAPWFAVIRGPVERPRIVSHTAGQFFALNLTIGAGEYVEIDCRARTVRLNGQVSRTGDMEAGSSWFHVLPGLNDLAFQGTPTRGAGTPPTLAFTGHSAWS